MIANLPPVTKALLIANAGMFLLQFLLGATGFIPLMLWPLDLGSSPFAAMAPSFQPWQLVTYSFLHGNLPHLLFNMLALVTADEEQAVAEVAKDMGPVRVNINNNISHGGPVNSLIEERGARSEV